jgi:lipopolysaccharide export LptBFGC system permease protein LptF
MTIAELSEYLSYFPQTDLMDPERQHTLAQFRTRLHQRQVEPFACLLVVLVGVPLGSRFYRRGPLMATALALGLLFIFRFAVELLLPMGLSNTVDPGLAVSLPYVFFGGIGLVLLARMESR